VELQETCKIVGDIRSRRVQPDEAGQLEGRMHTKPKCGDDEPMASSHKGDCRPIHPQKAQHAARRN